MFVQLNKKVLSIGSNMGDRILNIKEAIKSINSLSQVKKVSPIYETQAHVCDDSNPGYPFLNLVIEIETQTDPQQFLHEIKDLEKKIGRKKTNRWGPRLIDIDILFWDNLIIETDELTVPHKSICQRSFILAPLKDLYSKFNSIYRGQQDKHMALMKIYNITPDSFSEPNKVNDLDKFNLSISKDLSEGVSFIDIGAESTRPGASPLTSDQEWSRLAPYLQSYQQVFKSKILKPKLSVDTYHIESMVQSIELGADIINDVSGKISQKKLDLLKQTEVNYILMHSLDIPAKKSNFINEPIIPFLKNWLENKLDTFEKNGINLNRVIFDPGIGFGKTALQSIHILRNIDTFKDYPIKVLVGHSRKSFLNTITDLGFSERDSLSLGVSLALMNKNVDILRVHNTNIHNQAIKAYNYVRTQSY